MAERNVGFKRGERSPTSYSSSFYKNLSVLYFLMLARCAAVMSFTLLLRSREGGIDSGAKC